MCIPRQTARRGRSTAPSRNNQSDRDNSDRMDRSAASSQHLSATTKPDFEKLDIKDIKDLSDVNNLSAKQLKFVLTKNCVDYKGIFEKEVLREKVIQLWIDHNERKGKQRTKRLSKKTDSGQAASNIQPGNITTIVLESDDDDIEDSELCKICMEREIDCVLLECGHYLTCVSCGRKLAECPICRQNIVRCVRTFKG